MATLIPQGGVFSGIDRLNESLGWLAQMQENKRRNALVEGIAAEDRNRQLQEIQRQEMIRNAMSQPYTQQAGGPLMSQAGQDYQPVSLQTMQPTRELVANRLQGLGEWEQAIRLMPEPVRPENYTLTPGAMRFGPDNQMVASAPVAEKPVDYDPFGYGQMRNKQTNEIVKVPVAPTVANGGATQKPEVKLKPGERMLPDGTIEIVKGSSEYRKQSSAHSKDSAALKTLKTQGSAFTQKIQEVLDSPAFSNLFGGYNAYVTNKYPGETQNAVAKLNSVKSNLKKLGLDIMRQGGSIGQMTEKEWPIVEQAISNITPMLGEEEAKKELNNIITYITNIAQNAEAVYGEEWGDSQFARGDKPPTDTSGRPPLSAFQR